jgi:translation initiation factor IF-3
LENLTIGRRRFRPQQRETGKRLRINDQIRISPVRLITEDNEQAGVVDLEQAKVMAREASLDLVEVAPNSTPPVCRIMDYGKWKYQQKKKEQKARAHSNKSELKGVRLRPKIDTHDLEIKMAKAREFLNDANKVQFTMLFRGREMAHRDLGLQTMREICSQLADISKVESPPRMMGRRATMLLAPDRSGGKEKSADEAAAPAPAEPAPSPAEPARDAEAAS